MTIGFIQNMVLFIIKSNQIMIILTMQYCWDSKVSFLIFIYILIASLSGQIGIYDNDYPEREYEGYDGWYNNKAHPDWGGAGK